MSTTDNNNSLETMVEKTLESTGVLSKMRAELRANVFHILEKGATFQEKVYSDTIKNFVSNNNGILLLSLVKELLEYLDLNFTSSVFDPETGVGKNFQYKKEDDIVEELSVAKDNKRPMLLQILEAYQTHSKSTATDCSKTTAKDDEDVPPFGKTPFVQISKSKKPEPSKADNRNDSPTKSKSSSPIKISIFERDNIIINKNADPDRKLAKETKDRRSEVTDNGGGSSSVDQPLSSSSVNNDTDRDNNYDSKSLRNESSLDEVETDENISVANDSVHSSTLTDGSSSVSET
ncbi:centrosomal protein 43-like isoform X2 [Adelges cooleyi]|uniref:centrosomal protein 43-like isoform X2 n=1 Tax=Adelges cooleyi TaxID=133065 RepID=UPI00217F26F9|nr:centrosomal protein 43-like isoform X2 [Adelges cooleyi]XP_050427335.1 centrosomal protein 43-like isoform X2 [Adelges cooleyi]